VERCAFDAIEMEKPAGSKKLKAKISSENCFGCGACVTGCDTSAITLKVVRPPEHIPGGNTNLLA
jgi:ferredoxin